MRTYYLAGSVAGFVAAVVVAFALTTEGLWSDPWILAAWIAGVIATIWTFVRWRRSRG